MVKRLITHNHIIQILNTIYFLLHIFIARITIPTIQDHENNIIDN